MKHAPFCFSAKQKTALSWWCAARYRNYDAIICDGAVRSGKTLSMGLGFFFWAMHRFHEKQFALCGKTILSLRRNLFAELVPLLRRLGFHCEEKRPQNLLIVRYAGHENSFFLYGGRDESSASLIQGITLAGVLFDEVVLMPRSFVEQACARCSVAGSKLWFNCNPEGPQHWFYQEWILAAQKRHALYLHFTMEDNPSLTERIKARYRSSYSGAFYRRFILGEWSAAQGLIYDFYDTDMYPVAVPDEPFECFRVSVDYGTANPTSFGLWGKLRDVWYRIDEFYYNSRAEGRQMTDAEYVDALKKLIGTRSIDCVIVDPSAASFIEALRRENFTVLRADNRVADGIRITADLLKRRKIVICSNCTDCLREISAYCWAQDGQHDTPRKENDHAMDEMRYFAVSIAKEPARNSFSVLSVYRHSS